MKKLMLVVAMISSLLAASNIAVAGEGDASLFIKTVQGQSKSEVIPWVTYDTGKLFLDIRSNFDWPDAFAVFLGKSFQKDNSPTIVPEIGMIWSDTYKAVTPEAMVYGGGKNLAWITLNQIAFGSGNSCPDYAYHWADASWKINKHLQLGAGEQVYWEYSTAGADPQLDIGPALKVPAFSKTYAKVWWTDNPVTGTKKLFVSIGTGF